MSKLPNAINVCGVIYNIYPIDQQFYTETDYWGAVKYTDGIIQVNCHLPKDLYVQTVCHEWVHAVLAMNGFNTESENEQLVSALAIAINQTFTIKDVEAVEE